MIFLYCGLGYCCCKDSWLGFNDAWCYQRRCTESPVTERVGECRNQVEHKKTKHILQGKLEKKYRQTNDFFFTEKYLTLTAQKRWWYCLQCCLSINQSGWETGSANSSWIQNFQCWGTSSLFLNRKTWHCNVFVFSKVLFREDCSADDLIDVISDNRIYLSCLYVYNKIDQISLEEVNRIARQPHSLVVSCNMKLNLDYLLETLWEYLSFIRVYTKKPGQPPDFNDCLILRRGVSVEHVCHSIHRTLAQVLKYALVWVNESTLPLWMMQINNLVHFFYRAPALNLIRNESVHIT